MDWFSIARGAKRVALPQRPKQKTLNIASLKRGEQCPKSHDLLLLTVRRAPYLRAVAGNRDRCGSGPTPDRVLGAGSRRNNLPGWRAIVEGFRLLRSSYRPAEQR